MLEYEIIDHYTALSYTWGNATDVRTIWIDGSPMSVTANLYSALRDLQDKTRVVWLWVDAICINQSNDEEKRIYAMAHHTVIYLGSLEPGVELLLGKAISANSTVSPSSRILSGLQAADLILSKAWFRRIWVFQELIFSRDPWVPMWQIQMEMGLPLQFLRRTDNIGLTRPRHPFQARISGAREHFSGL
jgi:hypothetical protein